MSRKIGLSKTPPKSEARPLGISKPKKVNRADAARLKIVDRAKKEDAALSVATEAQIANTYIPRETFEELDARVKREMHDEHVEHAPTISEDSALHVDQDVVDFRQLNPAAITPPSSEFDIKEQNVMTLTFSKLSKKQNYGLFTGAANVLRIPVAAFVNKTPVSFDVADGVFAAKVAKTPRAQMTAPPCLRSA